MSNIDDILLRQIQLALSEDIGPGDLTTIACIETGKSKAEITAKSSGYLSGLPLIEMALGSLDKEIVLKTDKQDGLPFAKGDLIMSIEGDSRAILTAERTALNFLGHLSGVATLTSKFVEKVLGSGAVILDTRKTTPGLRYLEKYAVKCGGGKNHRFGLFDMALIKDNHIEAAGSITKAVENVREFIKSDKYKKDYNLPADKVIIEVEVKNEAELKETIAAGITRIMLDNQSPESLKKLVDLARSLSDNLKLEASGNVNLETVAETAKSGVDFISIGALTHSAPSSDFSLNFK